MMNHQNQMQMCSIIQGALTLAQDEVLKRKHLELSAVHLLWGLLHNPTSFASQRLQSILPQVEQKLAQFPTTSRAVDLAAIRPAQDLQVWLTKAQARAVAQARSEVVEGDLLRFMPELFPFLQVDYQALMSEIAQSPKEELPNFLTNLNQLAEQGKLDPVIGRTREIRALMEILGRRNKNNPVLVGGAGVGKTVIVEGLAEMIVKGQVPDLLKGKTIYALSMGQLMAGTKYRGEFEEKIVTMLRFFKDPANEAILFIDEIHLLVGAGKTEGNMDAANLLKPALARGELHCIGATTPEEYQKFILNDPALDRRFRNIPVYPPSIEESIEILMGVKEKQEMHHGIKISDEAIYQSVLLSDEYITDKNLPDKAIDLVDEAASALKLSTQAMPAPLVELQAEIRSKMILAQVEKNNLEIGKSIEVLQAQFESGKRKWEEDLLALKKVSELKNRLERARFDLEQAQRRQNYEEAGRLLYHLIPQLEKELALYAQRQTLSAEHIAQVIARQTAIPVEKILKSKQEKILELEKFLKNEVYAQDHALEEIAGTLMASHAGLTDATRPLGSFLLLGPTGVGKTQTVKALAQFLFNSEKNIIRLDMSEYSEKHAVAKLIGAPAGYVGYEEGGILTNAVRHRPYAVILLDEIEKAHPDFADILLQILDDGRLTDNKGRTVSFKNTILCMTSNAREIETTFKKEVLGRIDQIITYQPLDESVVERLIARQLQQLNERLKGKKVEVQLQATTQQALRLEGFIPEYGARPLQAAFNRLVIRPLAQKLLQGELVGSTITI